jgi:hypothetical protein
MTRVTTSGPPPLFPDPPDDDAGDMGATNIDSLGWVRQRIARLADQGPLGFSKAQRLELVDLCIAEDWFVARGRPADPRRRRDRLTIE